jgi:hypothetical protein
MLFKEIIAVQSSEHHTRRRENLKSHIEIIAVYNENNTKAINA